MALTKILINIYKTSTISINQQKLNFYTIGILNKSYSN